LIVNMTALRELNRRPPLVFLPCCVHRLVSAQEETTGAAEVLELLHHADSCNLDQLPPEGPTFTGVHYAPHPHVVVLLTMISGQDFPALSSLPCPSAQQRHEIAEYTDGIAVRGAGEQSPLLSPTVLSPKPPALALASTRPLQGGLKVAQRTGDSAAADPEAIALLHQKSSMGAATAEEAWTIHTLGTAEEGRNNLAV
jgi:hypothetical protein